MTVIFTKNTRQCLLGFEYISDSRLLRSRTRFQRLRKSYQRFVSFDSTHTQRVKMEDYLSESVYCHSGVPQGIHPGPLFFIYDMDSVFRIFKHVSVLGYADDLKLFKRIAGVDDCLSFQSDRGRLQDWCQKNKFDLNVGKCRSITFSRCKSPIEHVYRIGGHELESVGSN
jgi:Reverse transcriptase (RNA-dependent DNA polymerase)